MPPDQNIMATVLSFFKSTDEKLDKIFEKQDKIKDDVSEIKTELAVLKSTSINKEECEKKHNDCIVRLKATEISNKQEPKPVAKPFWLAELSYSQIIAWCLGLAAILGVLMGTAKVTELLK